MIYILQFKNAFTPKAKELAARERLLRQVAADDGVRPDGSTEPVELDRESARPLYREARKAAIAAGFFFPEEPIRLVPQDKLVAIVRRSQELALEGKGGEEEGEGGNGEAAS